MEPDQSIEIQLVSSRGEPLFLSNVMIEVQFFTHGNFRYAFGIGFTDEMGRITVSYSDLEKKRVESAEYFLMDYNTKLDDCDPRVKLAVLSDQELRERNHKALLYFGAPLPWATNWPANAHLKPQEKSVELAAQITRVEISTEARHSPSLGYET